MRIIVTGAHGFVGFRAVQMLSSAHEITTLDGSLTRQPNADLLAAAIEASEPDMIIHTAAISDVGECERDPDASYTANVLLTEALARTAAKFGVKLAAFSSDQVYTGAKSDKPFIESDASPANVYGTHKLLAENRSLDINPEAVFLRATWMYDMPAYGARNRGNMLVNCLNNAVQRRHAAYATDEYRGITYVRQVIDFLPHLIDVAGGAYNYGSENTMSMYDTALTLHRTFGLDESLVDAHPSDSIRNLWFDNTKLRKAGICFDTTAEGFKCCAEDYGFASN